MPRGVPGSKAPHGTLTRYTRHSCRCDKCRDAYNAWRRAKYGIRVLSDYLAEIEPAHGTETRYTSKRYLCRCLACKSASRDARARRRSAA